ncbi:MAG TPA: TonB-dependent receptor [Flavitalea sp.]|nr:TonB-dependent receptor [Flavitalea sp.]
MKCKAIIQQPPPVRYPISVQILRIIKITALMLVIGFLQVNARPLAQQISLKVKDASLESVIKQIKLQSTLQFLYDKQLMKDTKPVTVNVSNASVEQVLDICFTNQPLVWRIIENTVVIGEKKHLNERLEPATNLVTPINIKGRVINEKNEPVDGVTIIIKGTNRVTLTDANGSFSINADGNSSLVISSIGFVSQEIPVKDRTTINIRLVESTSDLDKVVVVGYGTKSKRDITSSIGQVKGEALTNQPITSFDQGLAGRIPGVDISQSNGAPGGAVAINIRGISSISGGNGPLVVVDGVPISSSLGDRFSQGQSSNSTFDAPYIVNPLSTINPEDIESVEVLKDAASAAIYGSRGSNGVILITTKKGKRGEKAQISFSAYAGIQQVTKKIDVMNAQEFAEYTKRTRDLAWVFKNPASNSPDDPLNIRGPQERYASYFLPYLNGEAGLTDTDWQDEIFRNAPTQNYEISASGGTEKTRYYISGNYMNQEGIVINSGLKRYSARINFETNLTKSIKFGINLNPSNSAYKIVQTEKNHGKEGVIIIGLMYHPNLPARNADGSLALGQMLNTQRSGESNVATIENPVALAELIDNTLNHSRILGNTFLEIDILKNLKFKTSLGLDINFMDRFFYRPKVLNSAVEPAPTTTMNYAWTNNSSTYNILSENTLVYDNSFDDHNFNVLLGYTSQKETNSRQYLEGRNFPNDNVTTLNAAGSTSGYSEKREWSLLSYFGRLSYSYNDRYLFSTSIRRDGSSRFGKNNKWGWFPSFSGGWRISNESFFPKIAAISDVKIRASYGLTGNTDIPYYGGTALLGSTNYPLGNTAQNGLSPVTSPNANLSWETTRTIDLGLDIGFFGGKVNFTADYYKSNTNDLLLNVNVPGSSGFSTSLRNIGEIENKGFEFMVSMDQKITPHFTWSGSFNFSANRNKVISLGPGQEQFLASGGLTDPAFIVRVGEPIGSYFGYQVLGTFKTREQFDKTPHLQGVNQDVGDFIYADANQDGIVNADDRIILGDNNPDFTWGINNTFRYRSFDLGFNIQAKQGNELFNAMHRYLAETWGNDLAVYLSDKAPRPVWGVGSQSHTRPSSWHVEDGSFVRVRNISLGYTFRNGLLKKISGSSARIYLSALNPFTWTKYSGYNPEVSSNFGDAVRAGEEFGNYPVAKSLIIGLNISF